MPDSAAVHTVLNWGCDGPNKIAAAFIAIALGAFWSLWKAERVPLLLPLSAQGCGLTHICSLSP